MSAIQAAVNTPLPPSPAPSRKNSTSSLSSASTSNSASTANTSASEGAAAAKAPGKASTANSCVKANERALSETTALRQSMSAMPASWTKNPSFTAKAKVAMNSYLTASARGVVSAFKYMGGLMGTAAGFIKDLFFTKPSALIQALLASKAVEAVKDTFASKATKDAKLALAELFAAELLPNMTNQDIREMFPEPTTTPAASPAAAATVEIDEPAVHKISKRAFGKSFTMVGAENGDADKVTSASGRAVKAAVKAYREEAEMMAWHQS